MMRRIIPQLLWSVFVGIRLVKQLYSLGHSATAQFQGVDVLIAYAIFINYFSSDPQGLLCHEVLC